MTKPAPIPSQGSTVQERGELRAARMLRELSATLAAQVQAGELTETQANDWLLRKQEQWRGEYNG